MPTRSLRGAFTLAEMMVASGLFALISLVLTSLIVQQMRVCTRASERLSLEREQMLLDENLRQDLMVGAAAGLSLEPAGRGIAIQPVEDVAPDGFLVYSTKRLIAYRYESTGWLHRYSWQVKPLPCALQQTPQRLTPANWAQLLSRPPDRNSYWTRLKGFTVRSQASGDVTQRLTFDTTWQDEKGLSNLSTCYFTRQNP